MTVIINIGRRVPRKWVKRMVEKSKGFISFQENLWLIINQSLNLAKKQANKAGTLDAFVITREDENEDMHYKIEWVKVIIKGTPEQEKEEYEDSMKLYKNLDKIFKKDMEIDDAMKKHFKTKLLSSVKVEEAYKKGYGAIGNNNLANKILEMGILTHIDLIEDY